MLQQQQEEFIASVSTLAHDLSLPLSIIRRCAELLDLEQEASAHPHEQRYVDTILETTMQMKLFINSLLGYSHVGQQVFKQKRIAMYELLRQVVKELQLLLEETQGQIFLPRGIPDLEGNPTLLRQIFLNLFHNALIYQRQGIPPQIRVMYHLERHDVIIGVADNGIGIAEKDLEKIFTPFLRLHPNEQYVGTGLGLASVKQAVDAMGGLVWVESVPGEGSTFWVKLPLISQQVTPLARS